MFETVLITLETVHGAQTKEQKVGTIKLKLVDDTGQECAYDIPGVVYDPKLPYNLLGIPFLSKFFAKDDQDMYDDGTGILTRARAVVISWYLIL